MSSSLFVWMMALTISICITILSAAAGQPSLHMSVTALVTLAIAIVAVQTYRRLTLTAPGRSMLAAHTARYTGLVWLWAGIAIFVTYNFILSNWREWWQFSIGLMVVGMMCLILAVMFERDAGENNEDESILKVARLLNVIQIVGMLVAAIGLVADHKFTFGLSAARPDWAANNIFFFGALAIAAIGVHSVASDHKTAALTGREGAHS